MSDRDVLSNLLSSSHDFRISQLDSQEDRFTNSVAMDQDDVIKTMQQQEIKRNRDRITEIIAFLEKSSNEIEQAEDNAY
jgi:hypothetical protein